VMEAESLLVLRDFFRRRREESDRSGK